jgi:hypothetical protein
VVASGCKWLCGCLSEQLFSIEFSKLEKAMVLHFSLFFQDLIARAAKCQRMMAYCETIRSEFRRPKKDLMATTQND